MTLALLAFGMTMAGAESFENFPPGEPLKGEWEGGVISAEQAAEGSQSLKAEESSVRSLDCQEAVTFVDFYLLPVFSDGKAATVDVGGARIGFRKEGDAGRVVVFENETSRVIGGGEETSYAVEADNLSSDWIHVTVRRSATDWDLYLNGRPVVARLALDKEKAAFEARDTYLDQYQETAGNPLFADGEKDGMPDLEEKAVGLNPYADDRLGDLDGDGVSNIEQMFAGEPSSMIASGSLIFVDNLSGNDASSGSRALTAMGSAGPKASIKAAMAAANSGDTIVVLKGSGIYSEGSRGAPGKQLTIKTVEPVTIQ